MFPEKIRPYIACDLEHPCVEAAIFAKALSIFQNSEEHVLNQILRNRAISREPTKEAEQPLVVPVEKETQFSHVSVPH
jgi:hypothetical protein